MNYEGRKTMIKCILNPIDYVSMSTNKYRKSSLSINLYYLIKYNDIVISDRNEYDVCVKDVCLIEDIGLSPVQVIKKNLDLLYGFVAICQIESDIYIKFDEELDKLRESYDCMFMSISELKNILEDMDIKYSSIKLGEIDKNQGDIVIVNLSANKELLESALDEYFKNIRLDIWHEDKKTPKYRVETNGIYTNIYYSPLYIGAWINSSIDKYSNRQKLLLSYGYML